MVWFCACWREGGRPESARVALTLEGLAEEFGGGSSGHNRREVAAALDALRLASFRARVCDARRGELRSMSFGLLDAGRPASPSGAAARPAPASP